MLSLLLVALLPLGAAAQPGAAARPAAAAQAAALVGRAFEIVAARPERGEAPEERRFQVERAGHRLLGRGFNVTETAAILALMEDWLKRAPQAKASREDLESLLEGAARSAHPDIRDGKGARGAQNWARFVLEIAQANS